METSVVQGGAALIFLLTSPPAVQDHHYHHGYSNPWQAFHNRRANNLQGCWTSAVVTQTNPWSDLFSEFVICFDSPQIILEIRKEEEYSIPIWIIIGSTLGGLLLLALLVLALWKVGCSSGVITQTYSTSQKFEHTFSFFEKIFLWFYYFLPKNFFCLVHHSICVLS